MEPSTRAVSLNTTIDASYQEPVSNPRVCRAFARNVSLLLRSAASITLGLSTVALLTQNNDGASRIKQSIDKDGFVSNIPALVGLGFFIGLPVATATFYVASRFQKAITDRICINASFDDPIKDFENFVTNGVDCYSRLFDVCSDPDNFIDQCASGFLQHNKNESDPICISIENREHANESPKHEGMSE